MFVKPLSLFEITNHHTEVVNKVFISFNQSLKIFLEIEKSKIPTLERIRNLDGNKMMEKFISKHLTNVPQVLRQ